MNAYGNMSSATVLYVLEKIFSAGFRKRVRINARDGPGLFK